jgi:hypothetical protein
VVMVVVVVWFYVWELMDQGVKCKLLSKSSIRHQLLREP